MSTQQIYKSHTYTSPPSSRTFHPFPRFPPELRLKIWFLTVLPPRLLDIETLCTKRNPVALSIPLFSVCRESRDVALEAYKSYTPWGHFEATVRPENLRHHQNHGQGPKDATAEASPHNEYVSQYLASKSELKEECFPWHTGFSSPFLVDFERDVFILDEVVHDGRQFLNSTVDVETLAKIKHVALLLYSNMRRSPEDGWLQTTKTNPKYYFGRLREFKNLETFSLIMKRDATREYVVLKPATHEPAKENKIRKSLQIPPTAAPHMVCLMDA